MKQELIRSILSALESLQEEGIEVLASPELFTVQTQERPEFGDYSTNVALVFQKAFGSPQEAARRLREKLEFPPGWVEKIDIAGPGFINLFINPTCYQDRLWDVLRADEAFGKSDRGQGKKVQVEYVSANPTGPLTVGHGRNAVLGDTLANLMEWTGHQVTREYYFNNAGRQMRILAQSVRARLAEILGRSVDFPEDGYEGDYIREIASNLIDRYGPEVLERDDDFFQKEAEEAIFAQIRQTLRQLGVHFDVFFNENSLYEQGLVSDVLAELKARGYTYEKDGAVWFRATAFGLPQDRVIVKSSGEPTYRLPDMAYHREKMRRGFDLIINVLGADHHAEYPEVLAGLQALGYDPRKVRVVLYQFVTLTRGGQQVRMSTRKASFVTLDELIEEVGADVVRYLFLTRSPDSHFEFDLDVVKQDPEKNPVFYVQYAHARLCSILRQPEARDLASDLWGADLTLLTEGSERALMRKIATFPDEVIEAAEELAPHRLTRFAGELAAICHDFYTRCRVLGQDPQLSRARLVLVLAARMVLRNTLRILGVSAPEVM
jgi:arginyl-tRNA synthetase